MPEPGPAFLGTGLAFPPAVGAGGRLAAVSHEEDVRQAICIILGTEPGERVMRPDFGAGLARFVFDPVSTGTCERVRSAVEMALVRWEPRIDLESVSVVPAETERNRLDVRVTYRVRATNTLFNLVYPFYLQEGAPE